MILKTKDLAHVFLKIIPTKIASWPSTTNATKARWRMTRASARKE
jgi:hypothetical protein